MGPFGEEGGDDNTHDMSQCSARDPDRPSDLVVWSTYRQLFPGSTFLHVCHLPCLQFSPFN